MRQRTGWFLVLAMLVSACQPDRNPAEPGNQLESVTPSTLDVLPTNGGLDPSPIITPNPDGSETIRFEFTFNDSVHNRLIEGQPYGIWFGAGDTIVTDPPTGNVAFRVYHSWDYIYNLPSPSHYAAQPASIRQSFLYFDPPVRRVSFSYSSQPGAGGSGSPDDSFYFRVVSTTGSTLNLDSIHANNPFGGPLSNWDTLTAYSTNEDVIDHIFFNGIMVIDDLEIDREGSPGIVCDTAMRGSPTTCRVRPDVLQSLDSVVDWSFEALFEHDQQIWPIDGPDQDTVWAGTAVTGGTTFAIGVSGSDSIPLHGELVVLPRTDGWDWDQQDDWDFDDLEGRQGCTNLNWGNLRWIQGSLQATLGYNLRKSECWPGSVDPSPLHLPDDHFEPDSVTDGGPNHGLYFVKAVDYKMVRGSVLNPEMLPSAPVKEISKKDSRNCPDSLRIGSQNKAVVNFYIYNVTCMGNDLTPLNNGVSRHEAYGTGGQLNGHEAQRRIAAAALENNPYAAAEAVVDRSYGFLRISVGNAVAEVDQVITDGADGEFHIVVNQNFQEPAFIEHNNGQFHSQVLDDY